MTSTQQLQVFQAHTSHRISVETTRTLHHVDCDACDSSKATLQLVSQAKKAYWEKSTTQRKQWRIEHLQAGGALADTAIKLYVEGLCVCVPCWSTLHGLGRSTAYKTIAAIRKGVRTAEHGNSTSSRSSPKRDQLIAWLRVFVNGLCDEMPHTGHRHLPTGLTRKDVFEEYKRDQQLSGGETCSLNYFYEVLRVDFPLVRFPKVAKFTKCSTVRRGCRHKIEVSETLIVAWAV